MADPVNVLFEEKGDIMRVSFATDPGRGAVVGLAGIGCFGFAVWALLLSEFEFEFALLIGGLSLVAAPFGLYVGASMATNKRALTATPEMVSFTQGSIPLISAVDSSVPTARIVGLEVGRRVAKSGHREIEVHTLNVALDDGESLVLLELADEAALLFICRKLEAYLSIPRA